MLMARLQAPSQGQILLDGRDAGAIRIADYARRVATLRQSPGFNLRLTVDELVAFGRFPYSRGALTAQDRHAIDEAIAFLDLAPLRQSYLDELSGGQRQMAFLAMTIAQQTDVLLLDEPLNNLDMKHAVQIMRALRRLCDEHGRTVILVIHDINFAPIIPITSWRSSMARAAFQRPGRRGRDRAATGRTVRAGFRDRAERTRPSLQLLHPSGA